jgi:hypothetical protein
MNTRNPNFWALIGFKIMTIKVSSHAARFLVICILSANFSIASLQPSNAIFGLSKCEKMVKKINFIDSINEQLWGEYNQKRNAGGEGFQYNSNLAGYFVDFNKMSKKGLKEMKQNPSCFEISTYSKIISKLNRTPKNIKGWKEFEKNGSTLNWKEFAPNPITPLLQEFSPK